jgi:hypothetical protein
MRLLAHSPACPTLLAQIWRSDGTTVGTMEAFDTTQAHLDIDPVNYLPHFPRMVEYRRTLFFSASRGRSLQQRPRGTTAPLCVASKCRLFDFGSAPLALLV